MFIVGLSQSVSIFLKSKMPFLSLRFDQFCDFCPKFVFRHLDPKGLKSSNFHPAL
ncbi:hypothetical protein HanPSC8_Chr11g0486661 [Helianthus annuus]|nr:hypothetical protein HanPSC8_Chr11g0486661 [Helianthus annuus]